jgi:hypothetical protein
MSAKHQVWLANDAGTRIKLLKDLIELEYVRTVNEVGRCAVVLQGDFDTSLFDVDYRLGIWRKPESGVYSLDTGIMALVRYWQFATDQDGLTTIKLIGVDLNDLLRRRIVAYYAGQSQTSVTNQADDMMKDIVRQNLGSGATDYNSDTARDISSLNFSVQPDLTLGPSITKKFAWQNMLRILQDIAETSRSAGTELYFDVVPTSETTFEFQTFVTQRGTDRTWPSGTNPLIFGLEFGNLSQPTLEVDRLSEVNYVYGGGQGEEDLRDIRTVSDSTRLNASQWNRCEAFADARNCAKDSTACVDAAANDLLSAGRPRKRFSGTLLDTPATRYGVESGVSEIALRSATWGSSTMP